MAKSKSTRKNIEAKSSGARRRARAAKSVASARRGDDLFAMLKRDHRAVARLVKEFEAARGEERKRGLAERICRELELHTRLEEDLVYPAAHEALKDARLVLEAEIEHQSVRDLIGRIRGGEARDEELDALVAVLGEYVRHHIGEEEREMFPQLRRTRLDLDRIADALRERRQQLLASGDGDGAVPVPGRGPSRGRRVGESAPAFSAQPAREASGSASPDGGTIR